MKRKLCLLLIVAMITMQMGCAAEEKGKESGKAEVVEEEVPTESPTEEPAKTAEPVPTEQPKEKVDYSEFEFILYKDKAIVTGFNAPDGYLIEEVSTQGLQSGGTEYSESYNLALIKDAQSAYFHIDARGHVSPNGGDETIQVEEISKVDTAYGEATVYLTTEKAYSWDGSEYDDYEEVALLNVEGFDVMITLSVWESEGYSGELEKMLPDIFEKNPGLKDKKVPGLYNNNTTISSGEYEIIMCNEQVSDKEVFGLNVPAGMHHSYSSGTNDYYTEIQFVDDSLAGILTVSTKRAIFEHYYNENPVWGPQFGTLLEKTEVGTIQTACGEAIVYCVKSEKDGKEYEEEVAVINNRGTNIVITYRDGSAYDGNYDKKLEGILK